MQQDLERAKRESAQLADVVIERGREQLEGAKTQVAEGAERLADAVEATADELESTGDGTASDYGRNLASMMRQMAGGLRERDIDEFASELSSFARRSPGAFLAGSVALGFGLSRFLKASAHRSADESPADFTEREFDDDDFIAAEAAEDYGAADDMDLDSDPASEALGAISDPSRPPTDQRSDLTRGDAP